jgi:hypothetical protein
MRRLVNMKNNVNAIRVMERMNDLIDEMKLLYNEFESLINESKEEKIEDLDSYENIPEEELKELIDEEYLSWVEANFGDEETNDEEYDDEDEDEEPEIYDIYLSPEEFETLNEYVTDIPFGYTFDSTENEYLVKMDEDMVYEIGEILEHQSYIEEYEECCRPRYERIVAVQNAIYYGVNYNL